MPNITITWIPSSSLEILNPVIPVRQVYVWFITTDHKFLIVSKDGQNWQFPGGKPNPGETPIQTAVRELFEETGVELDTAHQAKLTFFGYNDVTKVEENAAKSRFFKLRFYITSDIPSSQLKLTAEGENQYQPTSDKIMHVRAVDITRAKALIPWLEHSGEYQAVIKTNP